MYITNSIFNYLTKWHQRGHETVRFAITDNLNVHMYI